MKIVFLCGSLEPGRDGVGDYTRRLAAEMIRQGHQAAIAALYDRHLTETVDGVQEEEGISIPVLRMAAQLSANRRFGNVKTWIDAINPVWISLQFVPFAFHPKGLPFGLDFRLRRIGKGRQWHIMFHELWVGMESTASGKLLWWGRIQRLLIRLLIVNLKPRMIHTQTKLYQAQLGKLGTEVKYLPLFGNIPVIGKKNMEAANLAPTLSMVLFGTIHEGVPVEHLAKEAAQYAKQYNIKIILTIVGRSDSGQEHWASVWQEAGLEVHQPGELPPAQISEIFHRASLGISTTPMALLEKSGSVAAMREHGLSVLCVRQSWIAKGMPRLTPLSGVMEYRISNFEDCMRNFRKVAVPASLQAIGSQFANDLLPVKEPHVQSI